MRCPYCRQDIQVTGRHCPRCGRQIFGLSDADTMRPGMPGAFGPPSPPPVTRPAVPARAHPNAIPAHGDVVGKTCPYDQYPIAEGDGVIICPQCATPHHDDCWRENGGCTTYGCGLAPVVSPRPVAAHSAWAQGTRRVTGAAAYRHHMDDHRNAVATMMAAEIDRRAGNALIYALIGLPCCPVLSIIGFFMAVSVIATLSRVNINGAAARMKATWALAVGALAPVLWLIALVIVTESGQP